MPKLPEIQVQTFVAGPYSLIATPVKKAPGTHLNVGLFYSPNPDQGTDPVTPVEIPGCEQFGVYWVEGEMEAKSMAVEVVDALKGKLAELYGNVEQ